jgi:Uma2 family endonuclease
MVIDRVFSKKYPDSVVFRDVGWQFYRAMLREFDEQPTRINYDRGTLEVMTLSLEHERLKIILGEMITGIARTFRTRIARGGSSTLKRFAKKKGLEADQCYWVANAAAVATKSRVDLRADPPPDLVIEIDVMHAVVNRANIYRSLGVPELWVFKPKTGLSASRLRNRKWESIDHSLSFPLLRVSDLNRFALRIGLDDENDILADFADWLRTLPRQ